MQGKNGKRLEWGGNLDSKFEVFEGQAGEDAHLRYLLMSLEPTSSVQRYGWRLRVGVFDLTAVSVGNGKEPGAACRMKRGKEHNLRWVI